ncbi:MAG: hypothetical protein HDR38_07350 [Treponema sp.]|nr:hypothetical protein [Treponema sp.]
MITRFLGLAAAFAVFAMLLAACGTTQEVVAPAPLPEIEEPAPEEQTVAPENQPVVETPQLQAPQKTAEDLEYERSVGGADISRNTFEDDKAAILRIIRELSRVMKTLDYKAWVTYLDQESIDYWSRPTNLRKAQARLPIKGLQLKTLGDYFKYVFVPARMGREVTEIRYISPSYIKAVQVTDDDKDIVYYYFNKIDGTWKINIPPLNE